MWEIAAAVFRLADGEMTGEKMTERMTGWRE